MILVRHGTPTDPSVYAKLIEYLETVNTVFASAKDGADFKAQ